MGRKRHLIDWTDPTMKPILGAIWQVSIPTCVPGGCCAWPAVADSNANATAVAVALMRCINMVISPFISIESPFAIRATGVLHPIARSRPTSGASRAERKCSTDQRDIKAACKGMAFPMYSTSPNFRRCYENSEATIFGAAQAYLLPCQSGAKRIDLSLQED